MVMTGQFVGNAGFFVAVLVLARVLGPSGRGAVAFLTVTTLIVSGLVSVGIPSATTVLVPQRPDDRRALLANLVAYTSVACLLGGAMCYGTLLAVPSLRPSGVEPVVLLLFIGGTVFAGLVDAGTAFVLASERTVAMALILAIGPWFYAVIMVGLDLTVGLDVTYAGAAWVAAYGLWATLFAVTNVRWAGLGRPNLRLLRESVGFGVRAWIGGMARLLNFRFDQMLMQYLAAEAALGLYAVAVNLSEMLFYLPATVGLLLVPRVAAADASERLPRTLAAHRMTILITTISMLVAAVLGPLLIAPIFGDAYRGAVHPFLLLLPGAIGFSLMRVFANALMGSSLPGRSSIDAIVALVTGIVLDVVLIPSFGANGAAAAASVALLAGGAVAVILYRSSVPFALTSLLPRRAEGARLIAIVRQIGPSTLAALRVLRHTTNT
jgi:O-antigen/teichoic acid export membrane protein